MPVSYYLHTPLADNSNEWRAVSRLARLLERHFSSDPFPYSLILNIEPDETAVTETGRRLPQLDGLLIGHQFVATIELKNCYEPINAETLNGPWFAGVDEKNEPFKLMGGNAPNPFLQVSYARQIWAQYLAKQCADWLPTDSLQDWVKKWEHLSVFLLFFPYLHPDSSLPPLGGAAKWLTMRSLDSIAEIAFRTRSARWQLLPAEVDTLATRIVGAKPWPQLAGVRDDLIGHLFIFEPNRPLIRIPLYRFDDVSIGRSSTQQVQINRQFRLISGAHARIEVQDRSVCILDANSKNGTFVSGRSIDSEQGYLLSPTEKAFLGTPSQKKGVQVWYTLHTTGPVRTDHLYGTLDTQDR